MARAAVWAAFLRQDPALLAGLPDGLRSRSARLLTDLLAADLNALGETLTYLSARTALTIDYTTAAVAAARGGVQLTEGGDGSRLRPPAVTGNAAMPARGASASAFGARPSKFYKNFCKTA